MSVKNVVIGTIEEKKSRGRKLGSVNKNTIEKKLAPEVQNEAWQYFDGDNTGENAPMDDLLAGKKLIWKKKWLIWKSNHNKHGKIMSNEQAFKTGDHACDDFFGRAYRESKFIVKNKKTQIIEFEDNSFVKFCDYLNNL